MCRMDRFVDMPASEDSLEPYGVMGELLVCGEDSALSVDWLDPLPLLLPDIELCVQSERFDVGRGGGMDCGGGLYACGWLALRERIG